MNSISPAEQSSVEACFHCGESVPPSTDFSVQINGERQPMCCPGCRAVATMIVEQGLGDFYNQRTDYNLRPDEREVDSQEFRIYDEPSLLEQFADRDGDQLQIRLLIGGISCAACTWLIETTLKQKSGVLDASLNMAQQRLDVQLSLAESSASQIMATIAALGYQVKPWHASSLQKQAQDEYRKSLKRLAVAGVGMMQVGMFSIALHAGDIQGISDQYQSLLRYVSLAVTAFIVLYSAKGFFESAWRHLLHGTLVMDLPVALAIGLAFGASTLATLNGYGEVYFDSVVMFTFFLLAARFAEQRMRYRDAMSWQSAEEALPDAVQVWKDNSWTLTPRQEIRRGQRLLVRTGETLPVDGIVSAGSSDLQEDRFNGESIPRAVGCGDAVFAGTVNVGNAIDVDATGSFAESRLAALQKSIEEARLHKPAAAQLADYIASYFIGAVLLITVSTALVWMWVDPSRAFWIALSVLVISCPCALSLATPVSLSNATSLLRRWGVAVHGENALESLTQVTHVVFDKTGTLTRGEFGVSEVRLVSDWPIETVLSVAAALQRHSNHPIARAFDDSIPHPGVSEINYEVGSGVTGYFEGESIRLGSPSFVTGSVAGAPKIPEGAGYWIGLASGKSLIAWICLSDEARPEAQGVLEQLRDAGLSTELLTGDASPSAATLAQDLGFSHFATGVTPDGKLARVAELQAQGARVLMVGDGLNDAPVLQGADVSVAVAGATGLARAHADFVVLSGDLNALLLLRNAALRTRRTIKQNFAWALSYNALGIPLAALGLVPPWAAAIGMSLSSILVVANAGRLRKMKRGS